MVKGCAEGEFGNSKEKNDGEGVVESEFGEVDTYFGKGIKVESNKNKNRGN